MSVRITHMVRDGVQQEIAAWQIEIDKLAWYKKRNQN
jgi:hypothetical protein